MSWCRGLPGDGKSVLEQERLRYRMPFRGGGLLGGNLIDKLLLRLSARDQLSDEEKQALRWAASDTREVPARQTLIRADVELNASILLLEGFMCRYKDLRDGSRQITQLHVPGDFVDLHSFTLKRLDHHVMAITPCRVAAFPHERLEAITAKFPHLTRLLWFATNVDASCHREWALSLGRRTSLERIAHIFCELYFRLRAVGLTDGYSYEFPLTQTELSEAKGITPVHVNRTLRELREQGLVDFRKGRVHLQNLDALIRIADFSPDYLYLEHRSV